MIIVMRTDGEARDADAVKDKILDLGLEVCEAIGVNYHIIGMIGDTSSVDAESFKLMEGVEKVIHVQEP